MTQPQESDPVFGTRATTGNIPVNEYEFVLLGLTIYRKKLRTRKPDLDPLEIVRKLLDDFEHEESIAKSQNVARLHRIIENTHARRRLEKWSLRVIATYLLIVFGIIVATYADVKILGLPWLDIEPNIMIAILTTTTANIIGLGLIVLRGHFLAKESEREERDG